MTNVTKESKAKNKKTSSTLAFPLPSFDSGMIFLLNLML